MGATFPVLSRFVVQDVGAVGQRVGALYAWNTFGAVAGTYLVGFHLLPALGMRMTLVSTALVNLAVGGGVLLAARAWGDEIPARDLERHDRSAAAARAVWPPFARVLMLGTAMSGAVAMIYELAWTRALTLVIGSTTYAFSAMLLSFLIGIAAGSAWVARRASRVPRRPALRRTADRRGLLSLVVLALFDRLPNVFLLGSQCRAPDFIVGLQIVLSIAVMILPTFCLGAALPCGFTFCTQVSSVGLCRPRLRVQHHGSRVGSFAAGFVLIPWLGVQTTIRTAIVVNLLID
jgi:spermidine synthase